MILLDPILIAAVIKKKTKLDVWKTGHPVLQQKPRWCWLQYANWQLIDCLHCLLKILRAFSKTKRQPHSVQILYYCLLVFRAGDSCPHETFIDKHVCTICSSFQDVEKFAFRVCIFLFDVSAINKRFPFQNFYSCYKTTFFKRSMNVIGKES